MTEIILLRHAQANTHAKSEEDYDRLSDLGHQQSAWLGDYFRETGARFDRVISGTLRRHRETAEGLGLGYDVPQDPRLNELRYWDLAIELERQTGIPRPAAPADFIDHFPKVLTAWKDGILDGAHMPYQAFADQMAEAMDEVAAQGGRTLLITSGGVIGMAIARTMGLCPDRYAQMALPIYNSSLHTFETWPWGLGLRSYNATPHLNPESRADARTTV